jgi:hypothetical protein
MQNKMVRNGIKIKKKWYYTGDLSKEKKDKLQEMFS